MLLETNLRRGEKVYNVGKLAYKIEEANKVKSSYDYFQQFSMPAQKSTSQCFMKECMYI